METDSDFQHPLSIHLQRQTQHLASIVPPESSCISQLQSSPDMAVFLTVLSKLLADPTYTQIVATLFRPILMDLCARWLSDDVNSDENLCALAYLVEVHEELFPIMSRLLQTFYPQGPLSFISKDTTSLETINPSRVSDLLLAYYRILRANRQLPSQCYWSLVPLSMVMSDSRLDDGIRLLSAKCYSAQVGMGDAESEALESKVVGKTIEEEKCLLEYGRGLDGSKKHTSCWILENVEIDRVRQSRSRLVGEPVDFYHTDDQEPRVTIDKSALSPFLADIEGVFLLKSSASNPDSTGYIPTPSGNKTLRSLAHHVSLRIPTLLTSSPSAGKALILNHLAAQLYPGVKNQIITIHLADTSLDPRSLLGSYISSTSRPGTFEWKEGVLVRSMREGKWVVLEDVDKGSNEVLGTFKPLMESMGGDKWVGGRASIYVPGKGEVEAHENFMLFATRSLAPSPAGKFPTATFFAAHKFYETTLRSPCTEELQTILEAQFPNLSTSTANAVIHLWTSVKAVPRASSSRIIGLRELTKLCQRVERLLPPSHYSMDVDSPSSSQTTLANVFTNPVLREDVYLEARDVFFGTGATTASSQASTDAIANVIAEHLSLDQERCNWLVNKRTPDFYIQKDVNGHSSGVRVGRTYLPARQMKSELGRQQNSRPFALHRPAVCLLSRIGSSIALNEPVLLTGETGTGKTSAITYLASILRRPLVSLNLSHQTESADLIGGLKPIDAHLPGSVLQEEFVELFGATFSRKRNEKFETEVRKAVNEGKWKRAVGLWKECVRMAQDRLKVKKEEAADPNIDREQEANLPRKRRKIDERDVQSKLDRWTRFLTSVEQFDVQHVHGHGKFAFGFVEGPLVKALRNGDWILLDEINLASPETLECITSLLHGPTASITLTENGELEPIPRHPDFRLFACMNPATDVGKKDLPPNIRSRFTEIDVPSPDTDKETLLTIIEQYIGSHTIGDKGAVMNVAEFYMAVKGLVHKRQLADGSNHRPHFSMRSLSRALTFASDIAGAYPLRRAIWEGCLMAFTMVLDEQSAQSVTALAHKHLLAGVKNPRSLLAKMPNPPSNADAFVKFGPFYLEKGPLPDDPCEEYIITPSVEKKLIDLARIILTRKFPVLIEGPTSSGKTSSIEYLAKRTGHQFIRINNHEHTDIQEYIGSYVSDPLTGKLVFQDGLLVQALRTGSWIVLDELNLAPTDVLEALNRLLDDNRELIIPETQEVVRPHPHFMLFSTQNPPGLYGGRKILSRAFRNRFLEVHFDDVPQTELETILCQRCRIAPSYGKKIVAVFRELQKRRESSRVFESKQGFATLRDLFRWAGRDAVGYQELAENGYMLLAERARREEDKCAVKAVIESIMGVRIDENSLYDLERPGFDLPTFLGCPPPKTSNVIWTKAMQRLFVLVARALRFNEPVLLVGETGSGKTSVCQVFADATGQQLRGLNCHQNTETADIIGGLRPLRNRAALQSEIVQQAQEMLQSLDLCGQEEDPTFIPALVDRNLKSNKQLDSDSRSKLETIRSQFLHSQSIFEWYDGPLISSMRDGDVFLLDEISLAEDSVLERLNSVLEPGRTVVLAEQGGSDLEKRMVTACEAFKLIATMNPGGDYGKKELSPALRNRFTEIWVPRVEDRTDLELIINNSWKSPGLCRFTPCILDFVDWICGRVGDRSLLGLRDILAWVIFTNSALPSTSIDLGIAAKIFHHAAHMAYLDGLSSLPQLSGYSVDSIKTIREEGIQKLLSLVPVVEGEQEMYENADSESSVRLGAFTMKAGTHPPKPQLFTLSAPTTQSNAMRIARACQVAKPILLEGSPGVGKTSLVAALANMTGHELHRINLSDQTDLVDLFGSDLPVEGGRPGEFAWRDGEFLQALQLGHWVLLDEMNLAPQAVLEGLNAVLDHRSTVYIPELGRTFACHPSFRIFAAQNPLSQGGGRKGLPKSFVNRFTKVYVEELTTEDYFAVCKHLFPDLGEEALRAMISFNSQLTDQVIIRKSFGREGFPWEFNLRDIIRWGTLCQAQGSKEPAWYLRTIYLSRFRNSKDRIRVGEIFDSAFSTSFDVKSMPPFTLSPQHFQIGNFTCSRHNLAPLKRSGRLLQCQLPALESLSHCISQAWLSVVVGARNTGKTQLIRTLAALTGNHLEEIPINNATDTMDILGSFEQLDVRGQFLHVIDGLLSSVTHDLKLVFTGIASLPLQAYESKLKSVRDLLRTSSSSSEDELLEAREIVSRLAELNTPTNYAMYVQEMDHILTNKDALGRFEWVDGPLVRAMRHGHWVLLDGANLCNPSVLDRLNSLCEPDGTLVLSERGFLNGKVQVLKPHRDFRLFMLVDPQHGELSRAMRNRGIEISLAETPLLQDNITMRDHLRLPAFPSSPLSITDFDAIRRGKLPRNPLQPPSPQPLGLIQSSSASFNLLRQTSTISIAEPQPWRFIVPFIFRSILPGNLGALNEHLAAFTSGSNLPILRELLEVIKGYSTRGAAGELRVVASHLQELLPYKPMDVFLSTPSTENAPKDLSPDHKVLFGLLELMSLSYLLQRFDGQSSFITPDDKFSHNHQDILDTIEHLIHALQETIGCVLATNEFDDPAKDLTEVTSGIKLLKLANELQDIRSASTLDFSRAYATIMQTMEDLKNAPSTFKRVAEHADQLSQRLTLKTGAGLMDIWRSFYQPVTLADTLKVGQLSKLASQLTDNTSKSRDIRRQIFDALAVVSLPSHGDTRLDLWASLQSWTKQMKKEEDQESLEIHTLDPQHLALELGALAALVENPQKACKNMQKIMSIHFMGTHTSLPRLLPYQHLIWSTETQTQSLGNWARAITEWLAGIWQTKPPVEGSTGGPTFLLLPIHLIQSLASSVPRPVPLRNLGQYKNEIRSRIDSLMIYCQDSKTTPEFLETLLSQNMYLLAMCFADSYTSEQLDSMLLTPTRQNSLHSQIEVLRRTSNPRLKDIVEEYLAPLLLASVCQAAGLAWLALGRILFALVVPSIPIDPSSIQNAATLRLKEEESYLQTQILLHTELESTTSGNTETEILGYLSSQLEKLRTCLAQSPQVEQRDNVDRLHQFWAEVYQFSTSLLHPSKTLALSDLWQTNPSTAILQEEVIQESLKGFLTRLETLYVEFSDIAVPLKLAILQFRLGLRLLAEGPKRMDTASKRLGGELVGFPLMSVTSQISERSESQQDSDVSSSVLLPLCAIACEADVGVNPSSQTNRLASLYEQAMGIWNIDQARKRQTDEEANSLYRRRTLEHDALSATEQEVQEFLDLFPEFANALEDPTQPSKSTQDMSLILPHHAAELAEIHLSLFTPHDLNTSTLKYLFKKLRKSALVSILQSDDHIALPAGIDLCSRPLQLDVLGEHSTIVDGKRGNVGDLPNFYTESNIPEATEATSIVERLHSRVDSLILEWPDQEVLHHLSSCCAQVLALDLHSPVAKLLSAIEQLLIQSEDWEIYANRENSLQSHRDELIGLIVRWRRLELASWRSLLQSELNKANEASSIWWFRVYDTAVRGVVNAANEVEQGDNDALDAYLEGLVPLLKEFITGSPLGEYRPRMRLLDSFSRYVAILSDDAEECARVAFRRCSVVLRSLYEYFETFTPKLTSHLDSQRKRLEDEIKNFIKLASWKDINVLALRQSAQKSHHQLYKVVRKFREVLKTPVSGQISPQYFGDRPINTISSPVYPPTVVHLSPLPGLHSSSHAHIQNLQQTLNRYQNIINQDIRPWVQSSPFNLPDELACEIIGVSRRLGSLACPSALAGEKRTKYLKSIQIQKRKGWADLLKELKRVGFSRTVKPGVKRQQDSELWMHEQPSISTSEDASLGPLIKRADVYFRALQGCLPAVRLLLPSHHSDLSTRDVSRGTAFGENIFHVGTEIRASSIASIHSLSNLRHLHERIKLIATSPLQFYQSGLASHLGFAKATFCRIMDALQELKAATITFYVTGKGEEPPQELLEAEQKLLDECDAHRTNIEHMCGSIQATPLSCLTQGESQLLEEVSDWCSNLTQSLEAMETQYHEMNFAIQPLRVWAQKEMDQVAVFPQTESEPITEAPSNVLESLVDSLLLPVQAIVAIYKQQAQEEDEDRQISRGIDLLRQITSLSKIDVVQTQLQSALSQIKGISHFNAIVPRVLPFLEIYLTLVEDNATTLVYWTKALFKLDYVLCSLLQTLCTKGFCAPPDEADGNDEAGGEETAADGVGLGEGSGTDNVSKEIEDESQVEGLQNEQQDADQEQPGPEDEQGAIEMSEEFGGELQDVPENEGSDDEADSDTSSNQDIDEKIEDLDAGDPEAIDEKLWGDEAGPESKDNDEKTDQDHSNDAGGKSEMAAAERKDNKKERKDQPKDEGEGEEESPKEEVEMESGEGQEEESEPVGDGAPMDEHVPEANTLDLPDDLDLGEEENGDDVDMKDDLGDESDVMEEDVADEDGRRDNNESMDDDQRMDDESDQNNGQIDELMKEDDTPDNETDDKAGEDDQELPDKTATTDEAPTTNTDNAVSQDTSGNAAAETATDGQAGTSQSIVGQATASSEQKADDEGPERSEENPADAPSDVSDAKGSATLGVKEGSNGSQSEYKEIPNPLRSLGDAMKEIQHRFQEILNASEETTAPRPQPADTGTEPSQLEYLRPDMEEEGMQALAAADEQQVAKLDDLQFADTEDSGAADGAMDVDVPNSREPLPDSNTFEPPAPNDKTSRSQQSDIEGGLIQQGPSSQSSLPVILDPTAPKADIEQAELDHQAEIELHKWRDSGYPESKTESVWRLYESLTHDLAYALCEQLRLILDPTLATRLKGDYRTGKRLNMKKVISYIASDYTKDKIWLRRTKPSQREYQILVAIDDSRSMAESHSIHLAYESLALIGKALGRLESGDVAIAKFGESVELLHGFDEGPFTDQAGAKVISAFRFDQKATNVLSLLDTSLQVMENARERRAMGSSSAADLWQLEIIISDGMCQDHEKLRTVLRRAAEKRIMVVFVILDSLHTAVPAGTTSSIGDSDPSRRSILNMDRAEFKNVDGRMELQLQKYLDSFPFEYYVVLRDVEALPDILSSTLKQFFERIAEE